MTNGRQGAPEDSADRTPLPPESYKGRWGVWSVRVRNQNEVTMLIRIADVRANFGRLDLLVETNTGDQFWASDKTVSLVEFKRPAESS